MTKAELEEENRKLKLLVRRRNLQIERFKKLLREMRKL